MDKAHFEKMGESFGYPKCCIQFFACNARPEWYLELPYWEEYSKDKIEDGFIPCEKCFKILSRDRQSFIDSVNAVRSPEHKPFGS